MQMTSDHSAQWAFVVLLNAMSKYSRENRGARNEHFILSRVHIHTYSLFLQGTSLVKMTFLIPLNLS